ncbi:MAG: hypothetical protein KTR31_08810 [Myxococcales bacterium]|nr:hypothetical protein [Myxococcales bacterium]
MRRVIAQFQGQDSAIAAVHGMVARSYSVDDLSLRALRPSGDAVDVPIGVQSHLFHGLVIGGLLAVPIGTAIGWTTVSADMALTFGVLSSGAGAAVGGAIGLGSWAVHISKRAIPADASSFVVVATVPEGRAEAAATLLEHLGGVDAAPTET